MHAIRHAADRGRASLGWLDSRHTFSFGQYYDPEHMGFGPLRVINEDWIQPGQGFGMHGHQDMEIITYIVDGELEHKDSMGSGSVIRRGDVQRMSAGTGVMHSEFNHSDDNLVHLLQIWILPERSGLEPSYEEKNFDIDATQGELRLVGSRDARDGSVTIHQDVDLYAAVLADGQSVQHALAAGRKAWLQVVQGNVDLNGQPLKAGDGVAFDAEGRLDIAATSAAEVLLFDMG